jgi:hypothetical protein
MIKLYASVAAILVLLAAAFLGSYFYGYRHEVTQQYKKYSDSCYSTTMTSQVTRGTNGTAMFVSTCRMN